TVGKDGEKAAWMARQSAAKVLLRDARRQIVEFKVPRFGPVNARILHLDEQKRVGRPVFDVRHRNLSIGAPDCAGPDHSDIAGVGFSGFVIGGAMQVRWSNLGRKQIMLTIPRLIHFESSKQILLLHIWQQDRPPAVKSVS